MPQTQIIFYRDLDGSIPVLDWLQELKNSNPKGFANCVARIQQLQEVGYELHRPASDYLRNGIRELRAKHRKIQYRILYFYYGENVAILAHSIVKKSSEVPPFDIEVAIDRKEIFEADPVNHTYEGEINNEKNN
ncbi:MAG: type II toxin-antitoxin system RelE/ParE family toxin [Spirulina sp.]